MIHVPEATARELMNLAATENDEQVRSDFYLDAAQKRDKVICSQRKGNMFLQKLPSNCHQMLAEYETLPDLNSGRCFWTLGLFAHAEAGGR